MSARRGLALPAALLASSLVASCAPADRPALALGTPCASCSMGIADARFASACRIDGRWRHYDSIECLIRDPGLAAADRTWLSDYDTRTLHPADSLWVVKGEFPSPMGGGFAAFATRAAADQVARETHGAVGRLTDWRGGAAR